MLKFDCKHDYMCFLDERNKIKKFCSFSNFGENRITAILKFVFIDWKTEKVSQNNEVGL